MVAVGYIVFLVVVPRENFVHPDFIDNILQEAVRDSLSFRWSDFLNALQPRAPGEFRPRFLAYGLMTIDQKLRLILYNYFLFPSTWLPVTWILQVLLAPYLLFRLLVNLTGNRLAAIAGTVVFVSSIGFLSGIGMLLLQGKTLTNLVYIASLYLMSRIALRRGEPPLLLYQVPGWEKFTVLTLILAGCFLDEMPLFTFLLLPVMFPDLFWAVSPGSTVTRPRVGAAVKNLAVYALPGIAFAIIVLFAVPPVWEAYFGRSFDYLGNALVIGTNTYGAKSIFVGPNGHFGMQQLYDNFMTLFGFSLVPEQLSKLTESPFGAYPGTQITNAAKVVILVLFFGGIVWLSWSARNRRDVYLRRALVSMALFLILLCLVMIRQFPVATGYYYGAPFAAMFALLIGLAFAAINDFGPAARTAAAACVLWIVVVQIDNFMPVQSGWRYTHNELVARPRYEKQFKLNDKIVTREELTNIWSAWRRGGLGQYLAENEVSTGAIYLAAELRTIDRHRQPPPH